MDGMAENFKTILHAIEDSKEDIIDTIDNNDPLRILSEDSCAQIESVLENFYRCHHLIHSATGIISADTASKIDQCGVDFRLFSKGTSRIATLVANVFCRDAIIFFESIDKLKEKQQVQPICDRISKECKDISSMFDGLGKYVNLLCGRIDDASTNASENAAAFIKKYVDARELAEVEKKRIEELYTANKIKTNTATIKVQKAIEMAGSLAWTVIVPLVYSGIIFRAWTSASVFRLAENQSASEFKDAENKLKKSVDEQKEAEYLGKQVMSLVNLLKAVEGFCVGMAAFWNSEADQFDALSMNVDSVPVFLESQLVDSITDVIQKFKDSASNLSKYAKIMATVSNKYCFNINTTYTPRPLPKFNGEIIKFNV